MSSILQVNSFLLQPKAQQAVNWYFFLNRPIIGRARPVQGPPPPIHIAPPDATPHFPPPTRAAPGTTIVAAPSLTDVPIDFPLVRDAMIDTVIMGVEAEDLNGQLMLLYWWNVLNLSNKQVGVSFEIFYGF